MSDHRLPRTVSPRRYELAITPDLEDATFSGQERVEVEVHEEVSQIVLNAADLEVHHASLAPAPLTPSAGATDAANHAGDSIPATITLDAEAERLILGLDRPAGQGRWALHLSFSGTINDKLAGFYRSTFTDEAGATRVIATTQFEATDARRAFPCWDEPDRKAVFSVTLVVPEELTALSNTAVAEEDHDQDGRKKVRFADTMPMSTYLVAFVVGPLELTSPLEVDGVPLRIAHLPGKGHLTAYALEVGAHALRFFSDWFAIPYPSDKLDLVALPDFAFGAMENLGAVTFRESLLLVDPAGAARTELERVADVVCHEIAHMWFGDLVTMKWWNGLWLNEAFATFMETLCVDAFRPNWDRWVTFGRSRAAAFAVDGLDSTRPIEYPVVRPEDAEGMFDVLTYEKGASVLRMLERYLGPEPFRAGIGRYLAAHAHDNAETTDLWDAIEAASGEPARATMDTWIFQGGYPIVNVAAEGATLHLDQRRFRYRPTPDGTTWQVPVLLAAQVPGSQPSEHRVLLGPQGATVELPAAPEWVLANAGGSGFYRVSYHPDLLAALTADLGRLGPLERFNLVSDAWAEVLAGLAPLAGIVPLLRLLGTETDANVWSLVVGVLSLLDRVVAEADRSRLQAFTRHLLEPTWTSVGWSTVPGEDERRGTLRATLLAALGRIGADPEVRARAAALHAGALAGGDPIDPDLAEAIVSVVAGDGGPEEYEAFLDRFRHPGTPQEELRYLYGLAELTDPALVARTLELCLSEVRSQNAPFVIHRLVANRHAGPAAWSFVTSRWDDLLARFPDSTIPRMLDAVSTLVQPGLAPAVHAFLADHPVPSGQRSVDQALERLDVNVAFAQREGTGLGAALA